MPALDLWPILEQLEIKTKNAETIKLDRNAPFAWAQRELVAEVERQYNAGLPVRIIILKGRQVGCSTVTEAILFIWAFLHPGAAGLVISKEKIDSEYLFAMTKRFWETGPFAEMYQTKYNRQGYLEWAGTGSTITVETAKKADVGRGYTYHAVHGSEVSRWERADEISGSLGDSVGYEFGTIVVLESTARGVGDYFNTEWDKASSDRDRDPDPWVGFNDRGLGPGPDSQYTPLFFEWFRHKAYEDHEMNLKVADLDDEERSLLARFPLITLPKLAWRRRKLQQYTNPEQFKEEYPCTPEEAFLATGTNLFSLPHLDACYKPCTEPISGRAPEDGEYRQGFLYNNDGRLAWQDSENGHTFVYQEPDPRKLRRYAIGCDPTLTLEGDPACIQVMDRATCEQVCVWHGHADAQTVGEVSLALAMWYGPTTILNTEIQGGGKNVIAVWREAEWPHIWMDRRADRPRIFLSAFGWSSTYETKRTMLNEMRSAFIRKKCIIHHPATYYELARYVWDPEDDTYGPATRSGHDDCVISFGVTMTTVATEAGSMNYEAQAAPPPAYIPGVTSPRIAGHGRRVDPFDMGGFHPMPDFSDESLGVDAVY